jgi:5,10-methylenetetrahydromethanopterin reductase
VLDPDTLAVIAVHDLPPSRSATFVRSSSIDESPMNIGIFFDGFCPSAEMLDVSRKAEEAGAKSIWFAQHMGYRDALIWAAACAGATRSVTLVPTAISPYLWPPLPIAMTMATLAELVPHRVALCVSVGNLLNLAESGWDQTPALLRTMREYIEAIRALRERQVVHQDGVVHKLRGAKMEMHGGGDYPLYLASTGPQMLGLAGRIGDGILLSAGLTLESCRRCIEAAKAGADDAGRDFASVRKASLINLNVSRDGISAKRATLRKLAFLFRSRGHAENVKSSGLPINHEKIIETMGRHDLDAAAALLPIEAATTFAVSGTPDECAERLAAYLSVGLDEPIIEVSGTAEERDLALDVLREVAKSGSRPGIRA